MCFVQGAECNLSVVVFDLLQVTQSAHMAKRINDNQTSVSVCVCVCVCVCVLTLTLLSIYIPQTTSCMRFFDVPCEAIFWER